MRSLMKWGRRMVDNNSSLAEIRAWFALNDFARFQFKLDAETEEFRFKVLTALLTDSFRQLPVAASHYRQYPKTVVRGPWPSPGTCGPLN